MAKTLSFKLLEDYLFDIQCGREKFPLITFEWNTILATLGQLRTDENNMGRGKI